MLRVKYLSNTKGTDGTESFGTKSKKIDPVMDSKVTASTTKISPVTINVCNLKNTCDIVIEDMSGHPNVSIV